jgi:tRNA(Arg) A34 adenosine deaminase TadA
MSKVRSRNKPMEPGQGRSLTRREGLGVSALGLLALFEPAQAQEPEAMRFLAEAFRLRDVAVSAGDQPYGAVVVLDGAIVGHGRSRVVSDRNSDHHAERIALWDAQKRLGREVLSGTIVYSTSIPCMVCQPVLAKARVSRMIHGSDGADGGAPRGQAL